MAFATLCAASFGNVLFHFTWNLNLTLDYGLLGAHAAFLESYAVYSLLLAGGLIISQLRGRKPKPEDGFLRYEVLPRIGVGLFFCLVAVFNGDARTLHDARPHRLLFQPVWVMWMDHHRDRQMRATVGELLAARGDRNPFSDTEPLFTAGRLDSLAATELIVALEQRLWPRSRDGRLRYFGARYATRSPRSWWRPCIRKCAGVGGVPENFDPPTQTQLHQDQNLKQSLDISLIVEENPFRRR